MNRILLLFLVLMASVGIANADPDTHFDPNKYKTALQQHIIRQAKLTPQEAASFFPIYDEMRAKQREVFQKLSTYRHNKPETEKECLRAIHEHDKNEIEMKRIQQIYHNKLLKVVSATKLFEAIKAEEQFNRRTFRNMSKKK